MKKGSVTPFCALCLMLVASLLFALLELSRIYGLERYATLKADTGIDSVCAEYQPFLWQKYGLLFLDGAYGTEEFSMAYVSESLKEHIAENLDARDWIEERLGLDLFAMSINNVALESYALATDEAGELFLNYVAEREKENLPLGVAEDLYEKYQHAGDIEEKYGGVEASIAEAQDVLENVKAEWRAKLETAKEESVKSNVQDELAAIETPDTSELENTWDSIESMQNSSTLNLIFGDLSSISQKASRPQSDLQTRTKEEGTIHMVTESDWYRKLLVLTYLEDYFSNYTTEQNDHFLKYEMEYVLCGKETEWENLDGALDRILLMREAANVACLLQDKEKMALAETLAELVGLMAGENPAVVKVVQVGIIGAWAYLESVLDVRALVAGEVIPLLKQESEWTTDVGNILASFEGNGKAKSCANGMSYTDYLKQLLFLIGNKKLAYRMMEVMEIGMQSEADYINARMDHMIIAMEYEVQFESKPVFYSLVTIGNSYNGKFYFSKEVERSYIP